MLLSDAFSNNLFSRTRQTLMHGADSYLVLVLADHAAKGAAI